MADSDSLRGKVKTLLVDTPQGESGKLVRESQFVFNYTTDNRRRELALGMPLRAASYAGNQLPPILMMNVPEGSLRHAIKSRYGKQFAKLDEMALLSIVGHDQIGRLTLREPSSVDPRAGNRVGLREVLSARASDGLFDYLLDTYLDSGVSGVQPKVLIPDADKPLTDVDYERLTVRLSDLIVKSSGVEYPELTTNEFLCMDAARRAGIDVPEFHLSDDGSLFVVRRFDRTDSGERLGFEDMVVAAGQSYDEFGNYKYRGSYEAIATLIESYCGANAADGKQRLFEYVALSCMLRNGDAHMKNFGLLYESPDKPQSVRLAPLYDVVTTTIYEYEDRKTGRLKADRTLALKLNKSDRYPTRKELLEFATRCNVLRPDAVLDRLAQGMTESLEANRERVPSELLTKMQREWDSGRLGLESSRVSLASLTDKRHYKAALAGQPRPVWGVEQARRVDALPSLVASATGPLLAFAQHATTAIAAAGGTARSVDWKAVEDTAIRQSIVDDGQEPDDVYRAICEASPMFGVGGWREADLRQRIEAARKMEREPQSDHDHENPRLE